MEPQDETPQTVVVKKPDLIDAAVTRSNLRKRDVKPAIEAAFAVLADALLDGSEVAVPPLGKIRVVKAKELGDGAAVLTLKLRTPKNATRSVRPLASDETGQ